MCYVFLEQKLAFGWKAVLFHFQLLVFSVWLRLKAHWLRPGYYLYTAPDYRHTDKQLRLVMTQFSRESRGRQTDRRTLPSQGCQRQGKMPLKCQGKAGNSNQTDCWQHCKCIIFLLRDATRSIIRAFASYIQCMTSPPMHWNCVRRKKK